MYQLAPIGPALDFTMKSGPNQTPQSLREQAERAFRLAAATTDASAHDALMLYGQELIAKAERIEGGPAKPDDPAS